MGHFPTSVPSLLSGQSGTRLMGAEWFKSFYCSQRIIQILDNFSEKHPEHPCSRPAGNPSLILQDAQTCLPGIQLIAHRPELKHQGRKGSGGNQCFALLQALHNAPKTPECPDSPQGLQGQSFALPTSRMKFWSKESSRTELCSAPCPSGSGMAAELCQAPAEPPLSLAGVCTSIWMCLDNWKCRQLEAHS